MEGRGGAQSIEVFSTSGAIQSTLRVFSKLGTIRSILQGGGGGQKAIMMLCGGAEGYHDVVWVAILSTFGIARYIGEKPEDTVQNYVLYCIFPNVLGRSPPQTITTAPRCTEESSMHSECTQESRPVRTRQCIEHP